MYKRQLLRIVSALVRYKLGQLDMAETTKRFVLELAGESEDLHEANTCLLYTSRCV